MKNKYQNILLIGQTVFSLIILFGGSVFCQNQIDSSTTLLLGSTNPMFQELNAKEANSIFSNYIQSVVKRFNKKYNQNSGAVSKIYTSLADLKNDLRKNRINMLNITTEEYLVVNPHADLTVCLAPVRDNTKYSKYLLVTHAGKNLNSIEDLKGKTIVMNSLNTKWLGDKWLNVLLMKKKYLQMDKYFGQLNYVQKEKNCLFDVFFKKADCTVIRESLYKAMCELNPQIKRSIKIIETSPELIVSVLAYNNRYPRSDLLKLAAKEMSEYHLFAEGKQILTLYQTERLVPITEHDLISTKKMLDEYNSLAAKMLKR